jgi:hypothetical protein
MSNFQSNCNDNDCTNLSHYCSTMKNSWASSELLYASSVTLTLKINLIINVWHFWLQIFINVLLCSGLQGPLEFDPNFDHIIRRENINYTRHIISLNSLLKEDSNFIYFMEKYIIFSLLTWWSKLGSNHKGYYKPEQSKYKAINSFKVETKEHRVLYKKKTEHICISYQVH